MLDFCLKIVVIDCILWIQNLFLDFSFDPIFGITYCKSEEMLWCLEEGLQDRKCESDRFPDPVSPRAIKSCPVLKARHCKRLAVACPRNHSCGKIQLLILTRVFFQSPCKATGIASFWIFVGFFHPKLVNASQRGSTSPFEVQNRR